MTGQRGPHAGKEAKMMLAGEKPVAMFSIVEGIPVGPDTDEQIQKLDQAFHRHIVGRHIEQVETHPEYDSLERWYYYLPGREEDMEELRSIFSDIDSRRRRGMTEEEHRRIGEILGYSQEDIEVFLSHMRNLSEEDNNVSDNDNDTSRDYSPGHEPHP